MDLLREDSTPRTASLLVELGEVLLVGADVGLIVGVLQDLYLLESPFYIFLGDSCSTAHVGQSVALVPVISDEVNESLCPPREIGLLTEVRKGFLWPSNFLFDEAEFVAEGDEEFAVTFALEEGEDEDAGEIVLGFFDLGERVLLWRSSLRCGTRCSRSRRGRRRGRCSCPRVSSCGRGRASRERPDSRSKRGSCCHRSRRPPPYFPHRGRSSLREGGRVGSFGSVGGVIPRVRRS